MREWCNCGSSIRAQRKDVLAWRTSHRHDAHTEPEPEPDKQGSTSHIELRWQPPHEPSMPVVQARIGFTPNS